MKINKNDFQVLWCLEEGYDAPEAIYSSVDPSLDLSVEEIKIILKKLEALNLVKVKIYWDDGYKEETWTVELTEKAKEDYIRKAAVYSDWMPKSYLDTFP